MTVLQGAHAHARASTNAFAAKIGLTVVTHANLGKATVADAPPGHVLLVQNLNSVVTVQMLPDLLTKWDMDAMAGSAGSVLSFKVNMRIGDIL